MTKKSFLTAVFVVFCIVSQASAKEGFYIGAFVPNERISGDAGAGVDSGSGWGIRAGVGANRYFAIEGNYGVTHHDVTTTLPGMVLPITSSGDLKSLAGDLKVNFPLTSLDSGQVMSLEPYVMVGYAHYEQSATSIYKSDGTQWGVGVELYLFRELSVQGGWTRTNIKFKDEPSGLSSPLFIDKEGHIQRVEFGLIYHFI